MDKQTVMGILIPFLGTTLGAGCVLFMRKHLSVSIERGLTGFASGVMVAASIWSLIIPALEMSESFGKMSFLPAVI
ncbi:MAG: ZIP family metal transporter, partial [Erysipelotrichaceae bacterium]|nr:ZIP family metal transporter [Erysipelotrichaceae bacterium]